MMIGCSLFLPDLTGNRWENDAERHCVVLVCLGTFDFRIYNFGALAEGVVPHIIWSRVTFTEPGQIGQHFAASPQRLTFSHGFPHVQLHHESNGTWLVAKSVKFQGQSLKVLLRLRQRTHLPWPATKDLVDLEPLTCRLVGLLIAFYIHPFIDVSKSKQITKRNDVSPSCWTGCWPETIALPLQASSQLQSCHLSWCRVLGWL